MPLLYTSIDLHDVKVALKAKGYGFHSTRSYPLQLNVASKSKFFKTTGNPYREMLRGISQGDLDAILKRSNSVDEAVMHIENLSHGEEISALDATDPNPVSAGLSAEEITHIIDNRVGMKVNEAVQPVMAKLTEMMSTVESLIDSAAEVADPKPVAKKKRAKKAKKAKKPSKEEVDETLRSMGITDNPPQPNFDE